MAAVAQLDATVIYTVFFAEVPEMFLVANTKISLVESSTQYNTSWDKCDTAAKQFQVSDI